MGQCVKKSSVAKSAGNCKPVDEPNLQPITDNNKEHNTIQKITTHLGVLACMQLIKEEAAGNAKPVDEPTL
jgi:hypothetical protein